MAVSRWEQSQTGRVEDFSLTSRSQTADSHFPGPAFRVCGEAVNPALSFAGGKHKSSAQKTLLLPGEPRSEQHLLV